MSYDDGGAHATHAHSCLSKRKRKRESSRLIQENLGTTIEQRKQKGGKSENVLIEVVRCGWRKGARATQKKQGKDGEEQEANRKSAAGRAHLELRIVG